jgi:hypothetical protein
VSDSPAPERIDSFEKYIAWNAALPPEHRMTFHSGSNILAPASATIRTLREVWPYSPLRQRLFKSAAGNPDYANADAMSMIFGARQRFWIARELQRFATRQYTPLPFELIEMMSKTSNVMPAGMHFVHLSKGDPSQVAYTADAENGLRDRQLRLGFGRYLSKHYGYVMDSHIQTFEATLRAETSTTFEIHMGIEAIRHWYKNGPDSCMVKTEHLKPGTGCMNAYDAPGWGIAIIRKDGDQNRASARTLVWIDPSDDKKRYYIRTYGDDVLRRQLLRNGFVNQIPTAPLKYIERSDGYTLFPYFDSTSNNSNGDGGYILFDTERPLMLSVAERNKRQSDARQAPYIHHVISTTAAVRYERLKPPRCMRCGIIGGESSANWKTPNKRMLCPTCYCEEDYVAALTVSYPNLSPSWVPRAKTSVGPNDNLFEDTMAVRARMSHVQLDPQFYGPDAWVRRQDKIYVTPTQRAWHNADLIWLVGDDKQLQTAHIASFSPTGKVLKSEVPSSWIKLTPRSRGDLIFALSSKHVKKTYTGRSVVPGIHDVVQLAGHDDLWAPRSQCAEHHLFNMSIFTLEACKTPISSLTLTDEFLDSKANYLGGYTGKRDFYRALHDSPYALNTWMLPTSLGLYNPYHLVPNDLREAVKFTFQTSDQQFAQAIASMSQDDQLEMASARKLWHRLRTVWNARFKPKAEVLPAQVEPDVRAEIQAACDAFARA